MFEPHLASQFSGYPAQDFYGIIIPGLGLPIAGGIWGAKTAYDWATGDDEEEEVRASSGETRYEERARAEAVSDLPADYSPSAEQATTFPWRTAAMAAGGLAVGALALSFVFRD